MKYIYIAIVEDEKDYSDILENYLTRYEKENNPTLKFNIKTYSNAISFLDNYKPIFDIVCMDIRMPYMDGMDAAHRLRALDPKVTLIFITSLSQYAISGYEVDAFDYILKPINYYDFALKITRALKVLPQREKTQYVLIRTDKGIMKIPELDIKYIETDGRHVIYRTVSGDYRQYSSLTAAEKNLESSCFYRSNSCYVINLNYVIGIKDFMVSVDQEELQVSHSRKKGLLQRLEEFSIR